MRLWELDVTGFASSQMWGLPLPNEFLLSLSAEVGTGMNISRRTDLHGSQDAGSCSGMQNYGTGMWRNDKREVYV